MPKVISIIVPVFNEAEVLIRFIESIEKQLRISSYEYEIIFCVDPSDDETEQIIRTCSKENRFIKGIFFSYRIGQDLAILAGLKSAVGDSVIVMDCDLQDPPEVVYEMIREWENGAKIVCGRRVERKDNKIKSTLSKFFYRTINRYSDFKIPVDSGDFRLMDRLVVAELLKYSDESFFLRVLSPNLGFKVSYVDFSRGERALGITKYNPLLGGTRAALKVLLSYTWFLPKIFFTLSLATACLTILGSLALLGLAVFSTVNIYKILLVFFIVNTLLSIFTLFGISLTLTITGNSYRKQTNRPIYVIKESLNLDNV